MKKRPAFVMLEMIVTFGLLAALGALFAVTLAKMHRASDRLAEDRALWRVAESAMIDLQTGKSMDMKEVALRPVEGDAPAGKAWVELTVSHSGRAAHLVGLVPQSSIAGRATP